MRNIYKLIHMSFLHIWHFFQHCPTHHKATPPHSVEVCFRFVQLFFFPFSFFIIYLVKLSSKLIIYILLWYVMFTLLTKMLNWFLYFLQCSAISFVFLKIDLKLGSISRVKPVSSKNCSKRKLMGEPVFNM